MNMVLVFWDNLQKKKKPEPNWTHAKTSKILHVSQTCPQTLILPTLVRIIDTKPLKASVHLQPVA